MFRAPRPAHLPHLHSIANDIGQPVQVLAKLLNVHPQTVSRYIKAGQAPRPVMLALFWETSWGRSQTDTEMLNSRRMLYTENQILKRRITKLEKTIERLEKELAYHATAANSPIFDAGGRSA